MSLKQKNNGRIYNHPILEPSPQPSVPFEFDGRELLAVQGEVISSALFAAGIHIFGTHSKDGAPQGIFCANGQCSQCMVMADGKPVKACMTEVIPGMKVSSVKGIAPPPFVDEEDNVSSMVSGPEKVHVEVLIVGGGPAGVSAALDLGAAGVDTLVVDDKDRIGGKLTLQTHEFFGSVKDCWAGTRGTEIGDILSVSVEELKSVEIWTASSVTGVFEDKSVGVIRDGRYVTVVPEVILIATGAREKALAFPGADLPGVFGAGAFQTLVNRDRVLAAEKLFVIGGGNVGLIAAYHALQAGIDVLGLVEAMPEVGGYKVHADKLLRLGTPIWTRHTVVEAFGNNHVEGVTIAEVDDKFRPIPGTYRRFNVDTVLVAVGLSPVNEFVEKAREFGMKVYASGDAEEIAEASAAIFSGKIKGRRIARELGREVDIPDEWAGLAEVLKSRPGATKPMEYIPAEGRFQAVLHCNQEIPCNPCVDACPFGLITIEGSIMGLPSFNGRCTGCAKCVLNCPGLAITLVDHDRDPSHEFAVVTLPFEFNDDVIPGDKVLKVTDIGGDVLGEGRVLRIRRHRSWRRRALLDVAVPWDIRLRTAGFRIRTPMDGYEPVDEVDIDDDPIICRCERVRKSEIVRAIEDGVRDMNELKALLRTGMGACGGKTCTELIKGIFRELGVDPVSVTPPTTRPLFFEVPLGVFANSQAKGGRDEK